MNETKHLTDAQLVRAIDGEHTVIEQAEIDEHLVRCEECLERYEALADFSSEIETAVNATAVRPVLDARERLIRAMERERKTIALPARRAMQRWWWMASAAAAVVIGFLAMHRPQSIPKAEIATTQQPASASPVEQSPPRQIAEASDTSPEARPRGARRPGARPTRSIEASSSGFLRLPSADAALPFQPAGMVRVQMQLSMLAHAGVIQMSPGAPDAPVEADLLLGVDGQPYAVRLVAAHQ